MNDEERELILNGLREEYLLNKKKFEQNKKSLSDQQYRVENVLLKLEESIYFNPSRPSLAEADRDFEKQFLLEQRCCGRGFISYIDWGDHMKMHCEEEKKKRAGLAIKMEFDVNTGHRIYSCNLYGCNKSYSSAYGLKYHTFNGHKFDEKWFNKPHICPIPGCIKRYKNANGLKYHLKNSHNRG